jgi:hypothetical protein
MVLIASLVLDSLAAAQGVPAEVFGFTPVAEGNAVLSKATLPDGSHTLTVSNIGSSGLDGVSLAMTGSDGVRIDADFASSGTGADRFEWALEGTPVGGSPTTFSSLSVEAELDPQLGEIWRVVNDMEGSGGSGDYTLRLWDEGTLVYELAGLTKDHEILLSAKPVEFDWAHDTVANEVDNGLGFLGQVTLYGISGPGGGAGSGFPYSGDALITGRNFTGYPDDYCIRGFYKDTGDVTVSGAAQNVLGQWVTGNDAAQVDVLSGKLKVSNLGSSGCDGFSVSGGDSGGGGSGSSTAALSVELEPLNSAGPVSPGAVFDLRADATVQGELHEDFASITVTDGGPGPSVMSFGCDPNMPQTIWFVEYCLDDFAVYSAPAAGQVHGFHSYPDDYCIRGVLAMEDNGDHVLSLELESPVLAIAGATSYTVDAIRLVLPAADGWRVSDKLSLSVEVDGVSELSGLAMDSASTPHKDLGYENHVRHVTLIKQPLSGGGPMGPNTLNGLLLHDAPVSSIAGLFLGFDNNPTPFKKGVLVPVPIAELFILPTDPTGSLDIPFQWPVGIPAGLSTFAQYGVQVPGSPSEVWLSNALELISQ